VFLKQIGDAVFVRLSQKKAQRRYCSLVDADDFERVVKSKWYPARQGHNYYATATSLKYLPRHHARLHAFVLKVEPGQIVDHISGDTLDNRKQNLRIVTAAENARNARRQTFPGKLSRFKGVTWSHHLGRWVASITFEGRTQYLGVFNDEADAARAYDVAALENFGEHARTNEMMRLYDQPDPFVPDCGRGAKRCRHMKAKPKLEPWHTYNSGYTNTHAHRVDRYARDRIKEHEEKNMCGSEPGDRF
jgi:hypothetical protein